VLWTRIYRSKLLDVKCAIKVDSCKRIGGLIRRICTKGYLSVGGRAKMEFEGESCTPYPNWCSRLNPL
jgi:hypothetical protein